VKLLLFFLTRLLKSQGMKKIRYAIQILLLLFFDPGTQFPGNEKIRYAIQIIIIIILGHVLAGSRYS